MWKTGCFLVDKYRLFRKKCGRPAVSADRIRKCRQLHPKEDPEEWLRRQDGAMVMKILLIFLAGLLLFFLTRRMEEKPEQVSVLKRPEYGSGGTVYGMEVQKGDEEPAEIEVYVDDRAFTEQETQEKFREAYEEICQIMPGENESLEIVTMPLILPEKLLGGIVKADWTSESRELLDDWGEIVKEPGEIPETGEEGKYLAELTCGEYTCEYEISVMVYPAEKTEEESFLEALEADLEERSMENREKTELELPAQYGGEALQWYEEKDRTGQYLIWLFPVAATLFLIAENRQKEKEKLHIREKEMLLDYPELLSKFTVLVQAGMTTRNVWERMVKEYGEKKKKGEKPRYAYEEMEITRNQLKNGVYESQAYGEFGRRCGLHSYMKFGTLLEQNLKQGTTGLAVQLKKEAEEAFEERKNLARRLGEEAETKLMLPMFMMLVMVLVVIMVPAFLAF